LNARKKQKPEIQKEKRNQKEKLVGKTLTLCPEDF
jgi:hypothetical protein